MSSISLSSPTPSRAGQGHPSIHARLRPATLLAGAGACLLLGAALVLHPTGASSTSPLRAQSPSLPTRLSGRAVAQMPGALAAAASVSIGRAERSFWPQRRAGAPSTRGGGIESVFTREGAYLRTASGTLGLSISTVGRGGSAERSRPAEPVMAGSEVLYRHGALEEFYRGGPYGLEQEFRLSHRPAGAMGPLVLGLRVTGAFTAAPDGSQVVFRAHEGGLSLSYGQLHVVDADGDRVPASIRLRRGELQLRVDDHRAHYPLRIDPFIQLGSKLTGSGESGAGDFGESVALSGDGAYAAVGAPRDSSERGATWVFKRSGTTWTQQAKLTGGEETQADRFGKSVALSEDGTTLVVGGPGDVEVANGEGGAVWVFTRSGSTWSQQGAKLEAPDGTNVALSANGNTALFGGEAFVRSGSTWTQQGSPLTSIAGIEPGSVALSADGNTALLGDRNANEGVGVAKLLTRTGTTWTAGPTLIPDDEVGNGRFGAVVALSGDGDTALVASSRDDNEGPVKGSAWVFARTGSTWTQQGPKLISINQSQGAFGESAALSYNGNVALIGSSSHEEIGAASVFTRLGSSWTQTGSALTGEGESGAGQFGTSVALSAQAGTALVGAPLDNGGVGATWTFARAQPGCTDYWTNTAGGSWFDAEDWSRHAPPGPGEEACITAPGTYTVTMHQTSSTGAVSLRSLTIGATSGTQTLAIAGCATSARLTASYETIDGWRGAIMMGESGECSGSVTLGGPLANAGSLYVEGSAGGLRTIEGNLIDTGLLSLAAGNTLQVTGGYQQTPAGRLRSALASSTEYGSMSVADGVQLGGTLVVRRSPSFKPAIGTRFVLFHNGPTSTSWLRGAFESEAQVQVDYTGRYLEPSYGQSGAELYVRQAVVTLAPYAGPPSSTVLVKGSEFQNGDTATVTFTDEKGATTTYPSTVVAGGKLTATITIPASAALGDGTISVQSVENEVKVDAPYLVREP